MIRVVMLDLGLTLVDANQRLFDHVREALTAIEGFRTADSKPLSSCLVSDFTIVAPPITPAKVRPVFEEYLAVLDAAGLREFFEPVSKRVTLSTHVGVNKPDRAVFIKALSRLQSRATLEECLFITENADHIRAARQTMGMTTLQFKSPEATRFDFDDWSQAPALIAHLVDPHQPDNLRGAVQAHLAAHGIETVSAQPTGTPGKVHVTGQIWHKVSVPGHPELDDVHVAVPVEGELTRGQKGELAGSLPKQPGKEQLAEAGAYVSSLATHGQIGDAGRGQTRGATHAIETDAQGRRKLVRKRFSAV
jgi:HAD superfamily hydrolase (TIGR01509 family)